MNDYCVGGKIIYFESVREGVSDVVDGSGHWWMFVACVGQQPIIDFIPFKINKSCEKDYGLLLWGRSSSSVPNC